MKKRDTITAIERMVDAACGIPGGLELGPMLVCPKCGKERRCTVDPNDPPGTARIELDCPGCWDAKRLVHHPVYFNKKGKKIR